jgi:NAD(P)-dependent dehydrogenase (short-subunit alcohol dehydrogenase family)
VGPLTAERGQGRVINTASGFGKVGKAQYSASCASKFAVIGLTQSHAAELVPSGVTMNALCPGTIVEMAMREKWPANDHVKLGSVPPMSAKPKSHVGAWGCRMTLQGGRIFVFR